MATGLRPDLAEVARVRGPPVERPQVRGRQREAEPGLANIRSGLCVQDIRDRI